MVTHSSPLAWRIPQTEKPGGLQFTGLQRVRHDWVNAYFLYLYTKLPLAYIYSKQSIKIETQKQLSSYPKEK